MANKLALITGATSGIGAAFAKRIASQHYDLIITGRRGEKEEQIKQLAAELMARYGINIEVILVELTNVADIDSLVQLVDATKNLDILINNAGFTIDNVFVEVDAQTHANLLTVLAYVPIRLMYAALKNMLANNSGAIINVSSISAFMPTGRRSTYASAKASLNLISESVAREIKASNVRIQVLCPGLVYTDIWKGTGEDVDLLVAKIGGWPFFVMAPEEVVEASLRALKKNKVICIPGFGNRLLVWLATLKRLFSL